MSQSYKINFDMKKQSDFAVFVSIVGTAGDTGWHKVKNFNGDFF